MYKFVSKELASQDPSEVDRAGSRLGIWRIASVPVSSQIARPEGSTVPGIAIPKVRREHDLQVCSWELWEASTSNNSLKRLPRSRNETPIRFGPVTAAAKLDPSNAVRRDRKRWQLIRKMSYVDIRYLLLKIIGFINYFELRNLPLELLAGNQFGSCNHRDTSSQGIFSASLVTIHLQLDFNPNSRRVSTVLYITPNHPNDTQRPGIGTSEFRYVYLPALRTSIILLLPGAKQQWFSLPRALYSTQGVWTRNHCELVVQELRNRDLDHTKMVVNVP
ncbi:hypothetical protein B0H14DRAFT_3135156 [Mycena olivaceomarginata]|nr:hypothetical protein B0H14DRAFT_3135156 [Mycena olivaceomarginata]